MPDLATIRSLLPREGSLEEFDMSRRRRQNKGELTEAGGFWRLRWREDRISPTGTIEYGWSPRIVIAPSEGPGKLNRRQAEKIAWDQFLSRVNAAGTPSTVMTVANFVEQKFVPEHVWWILKGYWR